MQHTHTSKDMLNMFQDNGIETYQTNSKQMQALHPTIQKTHSFKATNIRTHTYTYMIQFYRKLRHIDTSKICTPTYKNNIHWKK